MTSLLRTITGNYPPFHERKNETMLDEKLEIKLAGHIFRLRAPIEEHECLKKAADHVNDTMDSLRSAGGPAVVDTAMLALQTAFRVSHEYFKLRQGDCPIPIAASMEKQATERLSSVNSQIDEMLRASMIVAPIAAAQVLAAQPFELSSEAFAAAES